METDAPTTSTAIADAIEFACYAKACAPPPVGAGGSRKGGNGRTSRATRAADVSSRGRALRKYLSAKKSGDKKGMARYADDYRKARNRVQDNKGRDATGRLKTGIRAPGEVRQTRSARSQRSLREQVSQIQKAVNARTSVN